MKKILILSLSILATITSITSCKKGENDPMLSLHSRKARIVGEWTLTNMESTEVSIDNNSTTTTTSNFNGTVYTSTETVTSNGSSVTNTDTPQVFSMSFEFNKDKTYTQTLLFPDGSTSTATGDWTFVGKNKSLKLKNKEAICLTNKTETQSFGGTSQSTNYTGLSGDILVIDQLKNKEIIIIDETENTSNGTSYTSNSAMTLTRK